MSVPEATVRVFEERKTSSRASKGKLTSCELEKIWLAERESSSEDSSESSRAIWLRLGMLLESGLSSSGSRSLRSRLSTERLRTPQLKLSMVSPCDTHSRSCSYCTLPTFSWHLQHTCAQDVLHWQHVQSSFPG